MRAVPKPLQRRPIPPKNGDPTDGLVGTKTLNSTSPRAPTTLLSLPTSSLATAERTSPTTKAQGTLAPGTGRGGVARRLLRKLVTSIIFYIQPSPRLRIAQAHLFTKLYRGDKLFHRNGDPSTHPPYPVRKKNSTADTILGEPRGVYVQKRRARV